MKGFLNKKHAPSLCNDLEFHILENTPQKLILRSIGQSWFKISLNISLQQKVSLCAKWFHWILSEFTSLVNGD